MKHRKLLLFLLIPALLLLLGLGVLLAINGHVKAQARPYLLQKDAEAFPAADCILILGCGVRPDGTPSYMLTDRLETGIALYEAGAAPKLLMSGDHGQADYDEVNTMKRYALDRGVPEADIFMDHAGFSTYESMYRARDVFKVQRAIVVSQEYHLYRAIYDARALGLEAWGIAAEEVRYAGQSVRDFREVLARNKDFAYCLLQPKPTFLGEAIPITGDGTQTNG